MPGTPRTSGCIGQENRQTLALMEPISWWKNTNYNEDTQICQVKDKKAELGSERLGCCFRNGVQGKALWSGDTDTETWRKSHELNEQTEVVCPSVGTGNEQDAAGVQGRSPDLVSGPGQLGIRGKRHFPATLRQSYVSVPVKCLCPKGNMGSAWVSSLLALRQGLTPWALLVLSPPHSGSALPRTLRQQRGGERRVFPKDWPAAPTGEAKDQFEQREDVRAAEACKGREPEPVMLGHVDTLTCLSSHTRPQKKKKKRENLTWMLRRRNCSGYILWLKAKRN